MAKSKTTAKRKGGAGPAPARGSAQRGANAAGTRRGVGKGEGLEVGNARRDAGAASGPMRRTATRRPAGKSPLQLPGEKAVKRTGQTIPVEPGQPAPGEREPIPAPAVDRRRQVVGTDEKGRRGGR